jgi:hypothetical protein
VEKKMVFTIDVPSELKKKDKKNEPDAYLVSGACP